MEFSLGRLELKATGLPLFENAFALASRKPFNALSPVVTVFRWDCVTQRGAPAQPLSPYKARSFMFFQVLDAQGNPDAKAEGRMLDRFVAASGLRTRAAFSRAFNRIAPAIAFPIDEAKLIEPFKADYKFHVTAFAVHNHLVVRGNGGRPGDVAYMSIPWYVYLSTHFDGACNNAEDPGISGLLETDGGVPALNQLQKDLITKYRADLDEAIERQRQQ